MLRRITYENAYHSFHQKLGERIIRRHHRGRRVEKLYNATTSFSRWWMYVGELCLALLFMTSTVLFGTGEHLPNNTSLVYPLYQISTLECRTQSRETMSDECKITLPIIRGADYSTFQNEKIYTDIYTVLRGASYTSRWDQSAGAHYAADIASARGTPLYAIADGEVYSAGFNSAYGNVVKLKFKYKGEILYAVYAHMDSITVKAGDLVKKGEIIGKVGNSGNVSGALGGYHVHFEIDKDNGGRPAYVFNGCEEINKGHYEIIQKGYCRVQLFQYTKDPILLLEQAGATFPVGSDSSPDDHPSAPENQKPTVPETPTIPTQPEKPIEPSQPQQPKPEKNQIVLDFSKLDISAKEFMNKRELTMERNFGDTLNLEQPIQITLTLKNKQTKEPFHGTLNQPLLLIASNTNIEINPVSTVLVSQGTATIHITPKKKGNVYLAINLGTVKIGGFTVTIQ